MIGCCIKGICTNQLYIEIKFKSSYIKNIKMFEEDLNVIYKFGIGSIQTYHDLYKMPSKFSWNKINEQKYLKFIQNNFDLFQIQENKRKNEAFIRAAEFLGPSFTLALCKRRFNRWMKKYKSLANLIKRFKDKHQELSKNQVLLVQNYKNQLGNQTRKGENKQLVELMGNSSQQYMNQCTQQNELFYIKNGQIFFIVDSI